MEGLELLCFKLISFSGGARSSYVEAINAARNNDFETALKLMKEGEQNYAKGHNVHTEVLQYATSNENVGVNLLLLHAEDQMMSAETLQIVASDLINMYGCMNKNKLNG